MSESGVSDYVRGIGKRRISPTDGLCGGVRGKGRRVGDVFPIRKVAG